MDVVAAARDLATLAHEGQNYGDQPYIAHCAEVVALLREHRVTDPNLLAAAWLHDTLEDTALTQEDIEEACGEDVARLVWACTGTGANRRARNAGIALRVATVPPAAVVKLADRLANVRGCTLLGDKRISMYRKEWPEFLASVGRIAADINGGDSLLRALACFVEGRPLRAYGWEAAISVGGRVRSVRMVAAGHSREDLARRVGAHPSALFNLGETGNPGEQRLALCHPTGVFVGLICTEATTYRVWSPGTPWELLESASPLHTGSEEPIR